MIAYDTLRTAWRDERARRLSRYRRLPALAERRLVLGADTVIANRMADRWGGPDLALKDNEARVLALLAVAYWRPVSPAAIGNLRRAAKAMARGDRALAAIHIAHTGLEKLDQEECIAFRLFCAERLLDAGMAPRELMTGLGLDPWPLDALKAGFDPDEPRDDRGRWTDGGGGDEPSQATGAETAIGGSSTIVKDPDSGATNSPSSPPTLANAKGETVIDPNTKQPYPVPPGMDIAANVAKGKTIAPLAGSLEIDGIPVDGRAAYMTAWFAPGFEMDYQRPIWTFGPRAMQYRNVTNYNFGAVAAAAGYTLEQALVSAGTYNRNLGNPQSTDTRYGIPADAVGNITQGWNDSANGKWSKPK
jgi:hypothetical protein